MTRLLHLEITRTCEKCPYCRFDNEWGGYDCWNKNVPTHLYEEDYHLPPIPDWCPLPIKENS